MTNFAAGLLDTPEYYTERKLLLSVKSNNVIVVLGIWS